MYKTAIMQELDAQKEAKLKADLKAKRDTADLDKKQLDYYIA